MRSRDHGSEDTSATATNLGKPVDSVPALSAPSGAPAVPSSSEAALAAANASNNQDGDRQGVEVNVSGGSHGPIDMTKSAIREMRDRLCHDGVFEGRCNRLSSEARDRKIVRFGCARGEDDFVGIGSK